jgi:hypothetical protein
LALKDGDPFAFTAITALSHGQWLIWIKARNQFEGCGSDGAPSLFRAANMTNNPCIRSRISGDGQFQETQLRLSLGQTLDRSAA